jgi:hypothetical protein
MKAAVGELHLRLYALGGRDTPPRDTVGEVTEQGALAHAGLTTQDGDSTPARERAGQELVECLTFSTAPKQRRVARAGLSRHD